jgi:pimeloyl-ACP methyl ester carboxylesterase
MTDRIPLILLPGLLNDAALWEHQTRHLGDIADMQVPDLSRHDSIRALAESVLAAAPQRFALAGLSMGGYVAQEILRLAPERVIKLALLDTNARADTDEQRRRRRLLMVLADTGEFKGVTPRLLPQLVHPDRVGDEALAGTITEMAGRVGKDAFLRQQTANMNRPDGRPDLPRIACPALVLCGRQDALSPPELHAEMADGMPQGRLVIIEECGHMAPLEQLQATTALLRYWLLYA